MTPLRPESCQVGSPVAPGLPSATSTETASTRLPSWPNGPSADHFQRAEAKFAGHPEKANPKDEPPARPRRLWGLVPLPGMAPEVAARLDMENTTRQIEAGAALSAVSAATDPYGRFESMRAYRAVVSGFPEAEDPAGGSRFKDYLEGQEGPEAEALASTEASKKQKPQEGGHVLEKVWQQVTGWLPGKQEKHSRGDGFGSSPLDAESLTDSAVAKSKSA